ncbi:PRC-barrel domain-containing protein [Paracoccus salsus]|uniref:PRC-barrel domain-containing protein n=1 Tax=Paracoccus salsus TaxID=2911061 RepID=UPI001F3F8D3B|nr:PRC-barrel domain-containing protein [Paracoccus salsus]MCF3974991.1 PRC-barrel domain-containing protein [Paracoccus salsus]
MKHLTTSAFALAVAFGGASMAHSETHMDNQMGVNSGVVDNELSNRFIRAENIIGANIYTQYMEYDETAWGETGYYEALDTDWEEVGSISDIVISRDGTIVGVIAEVGGWLDIGDAHVVIDMADLKTVGGSTEDGYGDLAFVTPLSEEQLESRKEVDSGWW